MRSLTSFQLKWRLTKTGSSVEISNDILTGEVVSFTDETVLGSSDDNSTKELMVASASWWTLTISQRWLDQSETKTTDTDLQHEFRSWTIFRVVASASDLVDLDWDNTLTWTNTFEERIVTEKWVEATTFATTSARDSALWWDWAALYPYTNIYVTATWLFYNYNLSSNQWEEIDTGTTTPNASQTVAGKVELATDAEIAAWTDTWWTWASLVATPSQINPNKYTDKTSATWADKILISDSADSNNAKSADLDDIREAIPASETEKWTVERATDAEATAWTDTTRYITPKQAKDNYWTAFVLDTTRTISNSLTATTSDFTIEIDVWFNPKLVTCAIEIWVVWNATWSEGSNAHLWRKTSILSFIPWGNITKINWWFVQNAVPPSANQELNPYFTEFLNSWNWWANSTTSSPSVSINETNTGSSIELLSITTTWTTLEFNFRWSIWSTSSYSMLYWVRNLVAI